MNKNIVIGVLLVVVAIGAYYMYTGKSLPSMEAGTTSQEPVTGMGKHTVTWKFESQGEDPVTIGAQRTKVIVTWDGTDHDAGTYLGSCHELSGGGPFDNLQEGQVAGALCYYAGSGDEIGVFNENGKFVIKHGEQQEPSGEGPGFRGNFRTLITL